MRWQAGPAGGWVRYGMVADGPMDLMVWSRPSTGPHHRYYHSDPPILVIKLLCHALVVVAKVLGHVCQWPETRPSLHERKSVGL